MEPALHLGEDDLAQLKAWPTRLSVTLNNGTGPQVIEHMKILDQPALESVFLLGR